LWATSGAAFRYIGEPLPHWESIPNPPHKTDQQQQQQQQQLQLGVQGNQESGGAADFGAVQLFSDKEALVATISRAQAGLAAITRSFSDEKPSKKEKPKAAEAKTENAKSGVAKEIAAAPTTLPTIALFGSLLSLCVALWRGLKAFGEDVAAIVAVEPATAKPSALRAQAGFRYRFATEFNDVTEAMAPATMVTFIDDLDRCSPAAVLASLEAVNFLATAGRCFVVIGMAEERVLPCVVKALAEAGVTPRTG
jgi:hypothetical protein